MRNGTPFTLRTDMRVDMRVDMCADVCADVYIDMCVGICTDTFTDMRMETSVDISIRHVYGRDDRHGTSKLVGDRRGGLRHVCVQTCVRT